ncbi:MAG: hypothetical protein K8R46_04425 [Pirellulales bacterium]|nr:hypothetical protein [Pirellulales bacterium]
MDREDYFLEAQGAGAEGEEATWARLKDLTAEEAAAVEHALKISSRPYGFGTNEEGYYELYLAAESNLRKNPGVWLALCREAEQGEEFVKTSFNLPADSGWYNKYHIIVMAKQFADLVRGRLNTTSKGEEGHVDRRFEVFDEDANQSVVFDATDAVEWGPVGYDSDWNGDYWNYQVEETLYRHRSGHWTMISESTHCEAPCSCGKSASRYDDEKAVNWLVSHGFDPPTDVAHLATNSFFKPGPPILASEDSNDGGNGKPKWDEDRRELFLNGMSCKRFRQPAQNQTRILAAFEECGWQSRIDDPIPPSKGVDRRDRLADTVRGLNKSCQGIRFELDGTGEGVIWSMESGQNETFPSDSIPF